MKTRLHALLLMTLVLLTYTGKAQDLTFSRVVDTLLVLEVGPAFIDLPAGGEEYFEGPSIQAPEGKVWKVNNLLLVNNPVVNDEDSEGAPYFFVELHQDQEWFALKAKVIQGNNYSPAGEVSESANGRPAFPLWVDGDTTIRLTLRSNSSVTAQIRNFRTKVWISIMEFNIQ